MQNKDLLANAETTINAPVNKVWSALTDPAMIKQYMFGTLVTSKWEKGSDITWEGEFKGKKYKDEGQIIDIVPNEKLIYTHYSPLSGEEDRPENYHTVSIGLKPSNGKTKVTLTQNKNATEKSKEESEKNWKAMLEGLKNLLEK